MRKVRKFNRHLLLSLYLCGFGLAPLTYASLPDYQNLILEGQSLTFNEKYDEAQEKFQSLIEMEPESPAGYFYLAMVYQARMKDLESDFYEKEFLRNLDKVVELTKPKEENKTADKWELLFLGNAYGSLGYFQARKGGWFSGFKSAKKAKGALEKAVKQDSTFWEAYFGLGSYHYWKSVATKFINWLPFIGDHRKKGIRQLQLASEQAVFFQEPARIGLMWIYYREKRYPEALELALTLQGKYPESKVPLWAKAFIYYEKYDWKNCLLALDELEEKLLRTLRENYYNFVEVKFLQANCHFNLGHKKICLKICEEILGYPLDKKTSERQKEKLLKTKRLREKCLK